jgi:YD repeat-containing protein
MKRGVLLLAACGASASEAPTHRPADDDRHLTTAGYCAPIDELGPFAHELFPACPAPPLRYKVRLCGEQPCASPCRYTWSVTGAAVEESHGEERYTYDEAGRLATVSTGGVTRTCAYDRGGRIVESCLGQPVDVRRAENGRLIAIGALDLRFDDNGRVIAIGDDELTYDTTGRIATYASRRLEWDGLMLAAEHFGDDAGPMRYRYDTKGYLVKVMDDESSTELTYDGNRLVSVVSIAKDERRESTFSYACN